MELELELDLNILLADHYAYDVLLDYCIENNLIPPEAIGCQLTAPYYKHLANIIQTCSSGAWGWCVSVSHLNSHLSVSGRIANGYLSSKSARLMYSHRYDHST